MKKGNAVEIDMKISYLITYLQYADVSILQEVKSSLQILRNTTVMAINKVDKEIKPEEGGNK